MIDEDQLENKLKLYKLSTGEYVLMEDQSVFWQDRNLIHDSNHLNSPTISNQFIFLKRKIRRFYLFT